MALDPNSGLPLDPATLQAIQEQQMARNIQDTGGNAATRLNMGAFDRGISNLFPSAEMQRAQQTQAALQKVGQLSQNPGENDLDYSIRQLEAQRDAVAAADPQSAAQMTTQLTKLAVMQQEQSRLKAQDQREQENHDATAGQRAYEKATGALGFLVKEDPSSKLGYHVQTFDMSNPDESQAFVDARKKCPECIPMGQSQASQLFSRSDIEAQKIQGALAKAQAQAGAPPTDDQLHFQAVSYLQDPSRMGDFCSRGQQGQACRDRITAAAQQLWHDNGRSDEDLAGIRQSIKAEGSSIGKMTGMLNNVSAFEGLMHNNGDRLLALINGVDTTGIPALEGAIRFAQAHGGNVNVNEFRSVLNSFQTEAAKILTQPNLTGQLTDAARKDLQTVVGGNLDAPSLRRIINRIYTEAEVRRSMLQSQISEAQKVSSAALRTDNTVPVNPPPQSSDLTSNTQVPATAASGLPQGWTVVAH